ncbi:MAG: InlB B-repeat-containing protein [Clostridiales bacterium]|nr:InlB B-repeat-containing protein [Clostridiales bacterium]
MKPKIVVLVLAALLTLALFYACSLPIAPQKEVQIAEIPQPPEEELPPEPAPPEPAPPENYEITFDENHAGGKVTTVTVDADAPLRPYFSGGKDGLKADTSVAPEYRFKPKRENATFRGWFTDKECEQRYDSDANATQDLMLYAGWKLWDEETIENMEVVREELMMGKEIILTPNAYSKSSFDRYNDIFGAFMQVFGMSDSPPDESTIGLVEDVKRLRESLVKVSDPEKYRWDIWGEGMAVEDGSQYFDFSESWDNEDFRPCLTPYMLRNQANVKGNIIVIAGGGFMGRANETEAYPTAEIFNELGYNAFVLQRRVSPYAPIDASIDLQRAVRYIKYNAEELGIGGIDYIAACGFSGGGITVLGMLAWLGSEESPSVIYPSYKDDDVDKVNAKIQAAIPIYGVVEGYDYDIEAVAANPDLPAMFIVAGSQDDTADPLLSIDLYRAVQGKVAAELVIFSDAEHGFGSGYYANPANRMKENIANVKVWPSMADTFMQIQAGELENTTPAAP